MTSRSVSGSSCDSGRLKFTPDDPPLPYSIPVFEDSRVLIALTRRDEPEMPASDFRGLVAKRFFEVLLCKGCILEPVREFPESGKLFSAPLGFVAAATEGDCGVLEAELARACLLMCC